MDGPPLFPAAVAPRNALPELKPVRKGDVEWEPLGFQYLRHLQEREARLDADAAAAVAAGRAAMEVDVESDDEAAGEEAEGQPATLAAHRRAEHAAERAAIITAATLTQVG